MKKPKTPIYNPEDLKALLLGECPYCGGKATVTLTSPAKPVEDDNPGKYMSADFDPMEYFGLND